MDVFLVGDLLEAPELNLRSAVINVEGIHIRERLRGIGFAGYVNDTISIRNDFGGYYNDYEEDLRDSLYLTSSRVYNLIAQNFQHNVPIQLDIRAMTEDFQQIHSYVRLPAIGGGEELSREWLFDILETRLQSIQALRPEFQIVASQRIPPHLQMDLRGLRRLDYTGLDAYYRKNKRTVIRIDQGDSCFQTWIFLGVMLYTDIDRYKMLVSGGNAEYRDRRRQRETEEFWHEYCSEIRWTHHQDIQMLQQIEQTLKCRLCIFNRNDRLSIVYPPQRQGLPFAEPCLTIYGLMSTDAMGLGIHIDLVRYPAKLFMKRWWCSLCYTDYNLVKGCTHTEGLSEEQAAQGVGDVCMVCHVCENRCTACARIECKEDDEEAGLQCAGCYQYMRSQECALYHECAQGIRTYCADCGFVEHPDRPCYTRKCCCGEFVGVQDELHECYLPRKKLNQSSNQFAVYDYECYTDAKERHVPYLVTVWFPTEPWDWIVPGKRKGTLYLPESPQHPYQQILRTYADYIREVPGKGPVFVFHRDQLDQWGVFLTEPCWKKWVFFAHNGRSYDHILVQSMMMKKGIGAEAIRRGLKVIQLRFPRLQLVFRDSLSFILGALWQMPKEFGLAEWKKGFFPHKVMTETYYNECVANGGWMPMVSPADFDTEFGLKPEGLEQKREMERWVQEWTSSADRYQVLKYAEEYCISDTIVLGECLLAYWKEMRNLTSGHEPGKYLDPFVYPTLPSAIMGFYLSVVIPRNKVAAIDRSKYMNRILGDEWLFYFKSMNQVELEYNVVIEQWRLSAQVQGQSILLDFYPCYDRGCLRCMRRSGFCSKYNCSFYELCKRTQERERRLKELGYEVLTMWECDWSRAKATRQVLDFFAVHKQAWMNQCPIDPRRPYRGGLVEYYALYYEGEISMVDIVSEYPAFSRGKTRAYLQSQPEGAELQWPLPVGHPEIHRPFSLAKWTEQQGMIGYAKVKVLAPRQLFAPYLGYQVKSQRVPGSSICLRGLCRTCMDLRIEGWCTHTDDERWWVDTWTIAGLRYAETLGYCVLEVYECWSYPQGSVDLFRSYMDPFLAAKICSKTKGIFEGGEWTAKGLELQAYGMELIGRPFEKDEFSDHPVRRTVAKNAMNSLTGKLGQMEDHISSREFYGSRDFKDAVKLYVNPEIEILSAQVLNEEGTAVTMTWKQKRGSTKGHLEKNDALVAHITEYGRMQIHSVIHALGTDALYCDTDSAYHKLTEASKGVYRVGLRAGDLEPELPLAHTMVITGRKSYAFIHMDGKEEIKLKGVMMNSRNQGLFSVANQHAMIEDTFNEEKKVQPIITEQRYFLTGTDADHVPFKYTERRQKKIQYWHEDMKRWVAKREGDSTYWTWPFGYCAE